MRLILDRFVKNPSAALRKILRHCGVLKSTPHSSGFARLAYGLFTNLSVAGFFFMVVTLICLFIFTNVRGAYASVLYTTPVMPPVSDKVKIIVAWPQNASGAGEEVFREAISEFNKGEYDIALNKFESLLTEYPNSEVSSIASLYAGSIYHWMAMQGEKKDTRLLMSALKSFQNGIRTYPVKEKLKVPLMLLEIGNIYLDLNMIAEAKGSFNRVIQEFPAREYAAKGLYMLALANMKEENYNDALSELNVLDVKYGGVIEKERIFTTGEIFFALHEFGESKKYYDEGLRRWPAYVKSDPKILLNYSECQFQNGELIRAREGFLTLYNLYSRNEHAGHALKRAGETFALERNSHIAEVIFLDVITYFPKSNDAYASMLALGDLRLLNKSTDKFYEDTLKYYKDVETSSDNEGLVASARHKTAVVLEDQGKYQQALGMYIELLGHVDKSVNNEVLSSLNKIIDKIGVHIEERLNRNDRIGALKLYQTYYRNNLRYVKNSELLMKLAAMHEDINLHQEASVIYGKIIESDGNRKEDALFSAGRLYVLTGDNRKAVDLLGRYITEYPKGANVSEAKAIAGDGHNNLKEYDKASNYYYAAMRDAPYRFPYAYLRLASILQNTGQYQESADVLRDMLRGVQRKDADLLAQAYISLGNSHYGMHRYQDAIDAYRAGLAKGDLKEGAETVEYMIGDCLFSMGRTDEARNVFSRLSSGTNSLVKQVAEERLKDIASVEENMAM